MSVTVLFPSGGETFQGGSPLTVQWTTTDSPSFQAVRLSIDGGATFINLANPDLPGSARTFTFNLPNPVATMQAVIRVAVKDAAGSQFGKGDSTPFTLQPASTQVMVTAPTGGVFQAGQQLTVNWNTAGPVSFHAVRISIDGGAFTNVTTTDLPGTARTFTFSLPAPPSSNSTVVVRVAAKDATGTQIAKGDSIPFTLQPAVPVSTQVMVTAPVGGTFQAGQQLTVNWNTTGPVSSHAVRLSINGGTFNNVTPADLPGTARSFTFALPSPPSPNATAVVKVAAKDSAGTQVANGDSVPFTLQPAVPVSTQVMVTAPAGGTFQAGQQLTVNWNTTGPVSFHAVRLSINGGTFNNVTAADLPGTARSFTFALPSPPSPNSTAVVKVAAKDASGTQVASGDSVPFTLQPAATVQVTVMFPNGGEAFDPLDPASITWQVAAGAAGVAIIGQDVFLSLDGGATYAPLATNLPAAARSFAWTVPETPSQMARVKVVTRITTGAQGSDQSDGLFAIRKPTITTISPGTLPRGAATTVTLTGIALPAGVAKYVITGPGGAAAPGLMVKNVTGTKTERQLKIDVSPAATPDTYTLTVSAAASITFAVASAASVAGGRLVLPPDQDLLAVRFGRRHDPASGALQSQIGVLLGKPAAIGVPASSLLLTFVPGLTYPALEIQRRGADRFTDFVMADLAGTDDHVLVGVSGKTQDVEKADIVPAFEVFEPKQGAVALARTPITFQGTFNAGTNPCVAGAGMMCDPTVKTDVDGAFVAKAAPGSKKEVVAIVPQTSFVACCFSNVSTAVHLLTSPGGTAVTATAITANPVDGNPLERNMVTFTDLGGRRRLVIVSKSVVFTFDVANRTLQNVRQISDPEDQGRIENSRDVPDFPTVSSCSPAQDQAGPQCTAQGRRYGQFRIMKVGGIDRLVLAGHSVSGSLNPLYTVYGNPLTETTAGRSARFLAPIAGWQDATLVPAGSQYSNAFRNFYRYLTEAKKKRGSQSDGQSDGAALGQNLFQPLLTFANGGLLLRGTPANGIDFLAGTAQPSLIASLADSGGTTASARFEVISADTGRTVLSQPGAIAYDLLRPSDPAAPARILAWGVAGKASFAEGRIEVYVPEGGQLTLRQTIEEEPVLLDFGRVNRPPDGLAVSGGAIALFNSCIRSDGRKAFLTAPRGDARKVSAWDVDDLTRRITTAPLGGRLFAVAEPGELPLGVAAAANGSTLVVQGDDKSLRFFAVASGFQLVAGALANPGVPVTIRAFQAA